MLDVKIHLLKGSYDGSSNRSCLPLVPQVLTHLGKWTFPHGPSCKARVCFVGVVQRPDGHAGWDELWVMGDGEDRVSSALSLLTC